VRGLEAAALRPPLRCVVPEEREGQGPRIARTRHLPLTVVANNSFRPLLLRSLGNIGALDAYRIGRTDSAGTRAARWTKVATMRELLEAIVGALLAAPRPRLVAENRLGFLLAIALRLLPIASARCPCHRPSSEPIGTLPTRLRDLAKKKPREGARCALRRQRARPLLGETADSAHARATRVSGDRAWERQPIGRPSGSPRRRPHRGYSAS
jgi:hypothetical protein